MPLTTSREIRLISRPSGLPTQANFSLETVEIKPLEAGEVLVRNQFMSVDPYMRGRMNDGPSYVAPFVLNKPLDGGSVGEVMESRDPALAVGTIVVSSRGWREAFVATSHELHPVSQEIQPLSAYLGALGMTGMTAWAGLNRIEAKSGDTIFVSGAAGAVGNVAGQLARLRGCRVIGSAGSAAKVRFLLSECGFDAAFDYREGPIQSQLSRAAPDGIDVYFDNVGGETLEAALSALHVHGRVVVCGGISGYNEARPGPSNWLLVIGKRLTIKGLLVSDSLSQQAEFESEIGGYFRAGTLKNHETVVQGIENSIEAFLGLFRGDNVGKMIVDLR